MPAPRKRRGRQDNRAARSSSLVLIARPGDVDRVVPPLPAGAGPFLAATAERWTEFWSSTIAGGLADIDVPVVERWIFAYDEWRRSLNAFRRKRLVPGSTGQATLNPLGAWVQSREQQLAHVERELAMGLKARADLGLTIGLAQRTMAEINRMVDEDTSALEVESIDDAEAAILAEEPKE